MTATLIRFLASALAFAGLASVLPAQTQCFRVDVQQSALPWSSSAVFPKFDPALGTLTSIQFDIYPVVSGQARVENTGSTPVSSTLHFAGDFTLRRPDNSVIVSSTPFQNFRDNLAAFDGNLNYSGPSGQTHNGAQASSHDAHTSPLPQSDLALFTGTGNITLPFAAVSSCGVSGGSSLSTSFTIGGSARVDICYNYIEDCNHNGIDDRIDLQNGMPDADQDGVPDECQPSSKPFCEGDGPQNGGANCPCSNNVPIGTIAGCLNGTGQGATLTGSGLTSVSNDSFVLSVTHLPVGVPAYFFMGTQAANQTPVYDGLRCLGGTITRLAKLPGAINNGGGMLPNPGQPPLSQQYGISPGDTRIFQVVYRSGAGAPCGLPANWSNALWTVWGL